MIEVRVPKVGMSTIEVEIGAVHVVVGQRVLASSVLVSAIADKVDFEIEAGNSGIVSEVIVSEGDIVGVGEVIARIQVEG